VVQASKVLQVSSDTVTRLVSRGVLARVPHVEGKVLIPRRSVEVLVDSRGWGSCAQDEREIPAARRTSAETPTLRHAV
jgi:hypothetical protein